MSLDDWARDRRTAGKHLSKIEQQIWQIYDFVKGQAGDVGVIPYCKGFLMIAALGEQSRKRVRATDSDGDDKPINKKSKAPVEPIETTASTLMVPFLPAESNFVVNKALDDVVNAIDNLHNDIQDHLKPLLSIYNAVTSVKTSSLRKAFFTNDGQPTTRSAILELKNTVTEVEGE